MANYSFKDPVKDFKDGDVIKSGNFSQLKPGTEIMKGLTLTIEGGNFTNVKKQPEWTVKGGNFTQVSRCSHLHPEWVERGLSECATECAHMTSKDEIVIDDQVIDTFYTYEDQRRVE